MVKAANSRAAKEPLKERLETRRIELEAKYAVLKDQATPVVQSTLFKKMELLHELACAVEAHLKENINAGLDQLQLRPQVFTSPSGLATGKHTSLSQMLEPSMKLKGDLPSIQKVELHDKFADFPTSAFLKKWLGKIIEVLPALTEKANKPSKEAVFTALPLKLIPRAKYRAFIYAIQEAATDLQKDLAAAGTEVKAYDKLVTSMTRLQTDMVAHNGAGRDEAIAHNTKVDRLAAEVDGNDILVRARVRHGLIPHLS